jgi:outer membrane protein TolC
VSSATNAKNITLTYEVGGLLIEIAEAYIDVLQARKQVAFFTNSKDILENNAKMAKVKFNNGSAPKTDLLRAEASFAQSRAQLTQSEGNLKIALQRYESLVGSPASEQLHMPVVKAGTTYYSFEDYYEDVLKFNPSLKSAKLYKDSADSSVNAARGQFLPKVVAKASYTKSENNSFVGMEMNTTESKIGLYASMPIFNRGLNANQMRKSLTSREIAYLNEKNSNNEVALYAQSAWELWNTAKEVKKAAQDKVDALTTAIKGIQLEAKLGRKSFVDVLQTQEEHIVAELELLAAEKQEIIAYFQMQQLVGKMTIKNLRQMQYD